MNIEGQIAKLEAELAAASAREKELWEACKATAIPYEEARDTWAATNRLKDKLATQLEAVKALKVL